VSLLGLAGLAEAALAEALGLMCLGVFLTITAAFFGVLLRSKVAAGLSAVLHLFTTAVFLPWQAFWPESSDDSDVRSFQASFRFLAWWWVVACMGTITACLDAYRRMRTDRTSPPS
jgi:hypothetical protein